MWTDKQNQTLILILDELIPANEKAGVPAAGALGVADFLPAATPYAIDPVQSITEVLKAVDDKIPDFAKLVRTDKIALLKDVETRHVVDFATLVRLTYMGYYSRSDVRPMFGVGAHPVQPKGYDVARESNELMDSLTAPVRARGQVFRDV
ncbi:hypothetical protein OAN307_c19290 [Octadecabacter antarcticus 307]|uniref:Gluconate 2-dehydrogenase subunit 3 family protein n=1 Tax=Octadecabacter antarcticus 307 TaxID=391626 RepID=M9R734_9RHOB|nr:hypothetical protein OAN307_c19290 [Octadecabacter antarcticus 307]